MRQRQLSKAGTGGRNDLLMIKKHKQGFVGVGGGGVSQSERGGQIRPESLWIEEQWFPTVAAHRINQELYKIALPMIHSRNSVYLYR